MPDLATLLLTLLTMLAFAGNSLLCRAALKHTAIDPASFTAIRILSGALVTCALIGFRNVGSSGSWGSALALFAYAACFSFAYLSLPAGTGALLLFLAVQATMVLWGLRRGERLGGLQWVGLGTALAGLAILLRPGLSAPPWPGALLMLVSGVAWGIYSLRGLGSGDPGRATAGNFLRAAPLALLLILACPGRLHRDGAGFLLAALSGALASGVGYALWYRALKGLRAATAASVQLTVPVLAALAGVTLLGEAFTARLALASVAILFGLFLVLRHGSPASHRT